MKSAVSTECESYVEQGSILTNLSCRGDRIDGVLGGRFLESISFSSSVKRRSTRLFFFLSTLNSTSRGWVVLQNKDSLIEASVRVPAVDVDSKSAASGFEAEDIEG